MRDYIGKRILVKGMRSFQVITKITLKKEKNAAGIAYSRAVFSFVDKLSEEQTAECKKMAEAIKSQDIAADIEDEYNTAPAQNQAGEDGFMNVPDGMDEQLPFN